MFDQIVTTLVQAIERQLVARQDQNVVRQILADPSRGAKKMAERIPIGLAWPDADIGLDLCDDLIGREKQTIFRTIEHDLFRCMPIASQDPELSSTYC